MRRLHLATLADTLVTELLDARHISPLATENPDGSIHMVAVWYWFGGTHGFLATSLRSRKARNLQSNSKVAFMIDARDPAAPRVIGSFSKMRFPRLIRSRNVKPSMILAITVVFCLVAIAGGNTKLLTADPLTNLPLYPATDSRLHLGNEPTRLPESEVCASKVQADFYAVYDSKVDATLVWYGAHLPGFKKTHAYAANRSQDTFYNSERTLAVSVTGSSGKADENTETYSVVYSRFRPALPEKAIISLNEQKVICQ
jgi:hypothetical protein